MSISSVIRCEHMPPVEKGMTVGLFGGSFNPPHEGHLLVADTALARLNLDSIWWIVTPGHPLKEAALLAPLPLRVAASEALVHNPRIFITAFEEKIGTRCSADTITCILKHNPDVHFVWIMGADNLVVFHHWQHWQRIVNTIPIAVIDRPGSSHADISSPMACVFSCYRVAESMARSLVFRQAPAWAFIHGRRSSMSSTALRAL